MHANAAEPSSWTLTIWTSGARLACATAAAAITPPASQPSPGAKHCDLVTRASHPSCCADITSIPRLAFTTLLRVKLLRRVLEGEPEDTAARSHRAYAYRKLARYAEAVADYTVALAGSNLGDKANQAGNTLGDKANQAAAPDTVRLYNNRGAALDNLRRRPLATSLCASLCRFHARVYAVLWLWPPRMSMILQQHGTARLQALRRLLSPLMMTALCRCSTACSMHIQATAWRSSAFMRTHS